MYWICSFNKISNIKGYIRKNQLTCLICRYWVKRTINYSDIIRFRFNKAKCVITFACIDIPESLSICAVEFFCKCLIGCKMN